MDDVGTLMYCLRLNHRTHAKFPYYFKNKINEEYFFFQAIMIYLLITICNLLPIERLR